MIKTESLVSLHRIIISMKNAGRWHLAHRVSVDANKTKFLEFSLYFTTLVRQSILKIETTSRKITSLTLSMIWSTDKMIRNGWVKPAVASRDRVLDWRDMSQPLCTSVLSVQMCDNCWQSENRISFQSHGTLRWINSRLYKASHCFCIVSLSRGQWSIKTILVEVQLHTVYLHITWSNSTSWLTEYDLKKGILQWRGGTCWRDNLWNKVLASKSFVVILSDIVITE